MVTKTPSPRLALEQPLLRRREQDARARLLALYLFKKGRVEERRVGVHEGEDEGLADECIFVGRICPMTFPIGHLLGEFQVEPLEDHDLDRRHDTNNCGTQFKGRQLVPPRVRVDLFFHGRDLERDIQQEDGVDHDAHANNS